VVALTRSKISGARSLFRPVTRQTASTYTRLIATVGLDALSSILKHSWAYSLAADASGQIHGVSYFSIRIRVPSVDGNRCSLHNLHIVAPPLQGSHTGATMFNLTAEAMVALDSQSRAKLIGVTSDGAANMAGRFSGWQKLLQNACQRPLYRVHCGPQCINLIKGRAIAALRNTSSGWFEKLYVAVKFLRKQANLIETMGTQSPYHVEVRWSSLSQVLQWHRTKADKLQEIYTSAEVKGFCPRRDA
jgi:hypothetical protein